ncbi:hypothetical protein ACRAR1_28950 [Streptomyces sanyensis]|uniref:hypothetical protein n=1 Tax=Streptomyces sanyensis TaxID=568869 RepID=UPI003D76EAF6
MELSGARVLVAGATGVIGHGITRELAARGARTALAGRNAARLGTVADATGPDTPGASSTPTTSTAAPRSPPGPRSGSAGSTPSSAPSAPSPSARPTPSWTPTPSTW